MARQKISEYQAKKILYKKLDLSFNGIQIKKGDNINQLKLDSTKNYVLKVDQGVKKRLKKGLAFIKISPDQIKKKYQKLVNLGYNQFLIEKYLPHLENKEQFFALEQTQQGVVCFYSSKGGINVEKNNQIQKDILDKKSIIKISNHLSFPKKYFQELINVFNKNYFSFLEVNPLIILNDKPYFLDLAVEVDSTARFFVDSWNPSDFVSSSNKLTIEEKKIKKLSKNSQASFSLTLLNKNGCFFMLLSGGGASLVLADQLYDMGQGKQIGNFGEYSGNPNKNETYLYTKNLLSLLIKSKSKKKKLIIAGGVANFTDIRTTFEGIIQALDEVKKTLQEQKVKIYVRRGGPFEDQGLKMIKDFLKKENIYGYVGNSKMILTDIIKKAIK